MIELQLGEVRWYGISRHFPSGAEAKAAFETVHAADPTGSFNVGLYRHQRVGLDAEPQLVSIVGHQAEGVERAAELLGGEDIEQPGSTWEALILRRTRVVVDLMEKGSGSGRYRIGHGETGEILGSSGRIES